MKNLIFILLLLFIGFGIAYSQQVVYPCEGDSSIVELSNLKGKGKVFDEDYVPDFIELPNYHSGISLTEDDLLKVERIINLNFENRYKKHWRQYLGFIDQEGNRYVFLHLEKFDPHTSKFTYENWKTTISIVNTEWNKNVTADYIINLEKASLESYYKWLKKYR